MRYVLSGQYKFSSTRCLSILRARYPLILFVPLLFVGQIVGSLPFTYLLFGVESLLAILLAFLSKQRILWNAILALLAGIVLSHVFYQSLAKIPLAEGVFIGKIDGEIRSPMPGELIFPVRIIESKISNLYSGTVVRCRAIDLPGRNASRLVSGESHWFRGTISPYTDVTYPWGFSAYQRRQRLSGNCKIQYISTALTNAEGQSDQIKDILTKKLWQFLGDDETVGLMRASLLGEHDTIGEKSSEAFRRTGLTHLVVVSGYQVGLIFSCIYFFALRFLRHKELAVVVGVLAALLYGILVGLDYTVFRASAAIIIFVVARHLERDRRVINPLLLALLIVLIVWPCCILDLSVQLTFAALSGLAFGDHISREGSKLFRYLSLSSFASIFPSLVLALWGIEFGPWGLILNPIVAPIFSIASVPLVIVGLAVGSISQTLATSLLNLAYGILWGIKEGAVFIDKNYQVVFALGLIPRCVVALLIMTVVFYIVARAVWRLYVTRGVFC